jgi:hypothetical protein
VIREHLVPAAALPGHYPSRQGEDEVEKDEGLESGGQLGLEPGADDARVVVDFAVGPPGVGPAVGFESDDFFPVAPDPDLDSDRPVAGDTAYP